MTAFRIRYAVSAVLVALVAVLSNGCSLRGGSGTIKGKITVSGSPLPSGLITFLSEEGNHDAFSTQIQDGLYEIAQVPTGQCKVTIIHSSVTKPGAEGNDLTRRAKAPGATGAIEVPRKYGNAETSGLSLTVKSGVNTFDQDLKP